MPFDRRHVLAQWGGTLPGGEIWSNSLRLASTDTGPDADVPDHDAMVEWLTTYAKDAVAAWHSDFGLKCSSAAKLTYLKMNVVDIQGHYVELNTLEHLYSPVVSGSSASSPHPTQISLAVSLTTEFSRGSAHRGRFFVPMPVHQVDPVSGLISVPDALQVATAAKTFIEALADEPGPDFTVGMRVCVMSQRGTGATNVVTGVDVGRALDTQQRRRNSLKEMYEHVSVDQGAT
jgi:hypothetical protein